jgi:hypothetical protein
MRVENTLLPSRKIYISSCVVILFINK